MAQVVIVGSGGMGREVAAWVDDVGRGADLAGFLDADPATHGTRVADLLVLGGLDWLDDVTDVEVVVAVGAPRWRAATAGQLASDGIALATIVHPTAQVGPRTNVGAGAIICPNVLLSCDVTVGTGAIINYGAMIGHDGIIGDAAFIAPGAHLAGNVTVEEQADVGIGASVIQGVTIGQRAVVGAGAVVIRDVAADTTVVGVPARPIEERRT